MEFAERISDIGVHKSVIVTTAGFQPAAYSVAAGRGIALVVTEPVWDVVFGVTPFEGAPPFGGITVDAKNVPIAAQEELGLAWESVLMFLVDASGERGFNLYVKKNSYWIIDEHGAKGLDRQRLNDEARAHMDRAALERARRAEQRKQQIEEESSAVTSERRHLSSVRFVRGADVA